MIKSNLFTRDGPTIKEAVRAAEKLVKPGEDVWQHAAALFFRIKYEKVTQEERRFVKSQGYISFY